MNIDKIIDRQELQMRLDGDMGLLQELIALFLTDYPKLISEISMAIERHDGATLKKTAHTLKGSVGNFCAKKAYNLAFQLENSGANGDFSQTKFLFDQLTQEMQRVEKALQILVVELAS